MDVEETAKKTIIVVRLIDIDYNNEQNFMPRAGLRSLGTLYI